MGGDYSAQIIEEIASVFHDSVSEPFGAQIRVTEIEFCDVGSSERAFRIAAREAARSLIAVGALTEMRPTSTPKPNGEPTGTGQPATRAVVKPEGGDKPQTEAEGRSR